jgi:hypothetical protein
VADVPHFKSVLEGEGIEKASKVSHVLCVSGSHVSDLFQLRLWTLTVPLPNIRPILIAAKAIAGNLKAPELSIDLHDILGRLFALNFRVISYASDGTEVERALQHEISAQPAFREYRLTHPSGDGTALVFRIPAFLGHPIVMIQDSKHALKTARNNLFSGARLLVLGNYIAAYEYARPLAFDNSTSVPPPLYRRDVERLDRQDDNAAARLFSKATLEFLVKQYPN